MGRHRTSAWCPPAGGVGWLSAKNAFKIPIHLFVLGKHDFLKVLRDQPKVARTVAAQAKARYQLDLGARAIAKLAAPG